MQIPWWAKCPLFNITSGGIYSYHCAVRTKNWTVYGQCVWYSACVAPDLMHFIQLHPIVPTRCFLISGVMTRLSVARAIFGNVHTELNRLWRVVLMRITQFSHPFFFLMGWDRVHLVLRPLFGLLYQPQMMMIVDQSVECELAGETEVLWSNLYPVPLCPPQIPHDLTRAAAEGSRRLRLIWQGQFSHP
jgi:hypothetical protein